VVERNGAAVFPRDFPATALADGDAVEVIRIVAGG
jgi:thiamine biosynthesis protein ThiS